MPTGKNTQHSHLQQSSASLVHNVLTAPMCHFTKVHLLIYAYIYFRSRDSVVDIATGYGLDDRGVAVRVPVGSKIFSSSRRPDRLWGPPSLLYNGYRG
jgi:hypothetical protein